MITVAGFNTAVDRSIRIDALLPGHVQRATHVTIHPSGKGLHVAQTIAALGEPVQLVGLINAVHRQRIGEHLQKRGVLFHGVEISGELRSNLALREASGRVTEILDPGMMIDASARQQLVDTLFRWVENSRCVVMSGSLPMGFPDDAYAQWVRMLDLPCLVDASGSALHHAADSGAHLLKPNRDEASELAGQPVTTIDDAVALAANLHARGISRPIVTLGEQGAVGFDGTDAWHASLVLDHHEHAVGSGDCFLAGVAVALARGGDLGDALRLGVACGAANAKHEEIGYVDRHLVDELYPQVRLQRLGG
jgi:1-phosphofructokinase family hexose kinase